MDNDNPTLSTLVSPEWLARHLHSHKHLLLIACHCNPSSHDRTEALDLFHSLHIPNSLFCDINDLSEPSSSLPHTLPSEKHFQEQAQNLGVSSHHAIVCYSIGPIPAAHRIWWLFRTFGHEQVGVLNTSLDAWHEKGYPTTSQKSTSPHAATSSPPSKGNFTAHFQPHLVADHRHVLDVTSPPLNHPKVIDARTEDRFLGTTPELRPSLPSGHIPGSINLPFPRIFSQPHTLLPPHELSQVFEQHHIDPQQSHIYTCGSGVTACILAWAQASLTSQESAVYDGSWTEWASDPSRPIITSQNPKE